MSIVGSIQARMNSTRLPGKTLRMVAGKPLLGWQISRLKKSRLLDDIVVATSTSPEDDLLEEYCDQNEIKCFRGSEHDVLGRVAGLIEKYEIDTHVELYCDCTLIDPHIIDELIGFYLKMQPHYDCVCNSLKTTYPPGQEAVVHRGSLLIDVNRRVRNDDPMREHVGVHITKNAMYNVCNLSAPTHYFFPDMYLEVDTINDLKVISEVIDHFSNLGVEHFSLAEMITYLNEHPDLLAINRSEHRRWKEFRDEC